MSDVVYERAVDDYYAEFQALLHGMDEPEPEPTVNCSRCGRPLTNEDRQADGMGAWCRRHDPHRRRLRFLQLDPDGASRFQMYSRSRAGTDIRHDIRIHFENGEFHCSCEHHKFTGKTCEHIKRACATERRRRERDVEI
jgi:hypothetical protein